jgi:hypothetical protein
MSIVDVHGMVSIYLVHGSVVVGGLHTVKSYLSNSTW